MRVRKGTAAGAARRGLTDSSAKSVRPRLPKVRAVVVPRATAGPRTVREPKRNGSARVPLTITLDAENLAFIESCVSLKEFHSVDALFDAALACYLERVRALNAYAEDQSHKGYSRAEILESVECETVLVKTV
jgi:hypothetical protein